jgi:hypothetical protein
VPSNAYPTIQAAVNDATCATINVAAGTYPEHVTIARNVTIRGVGQDSTVLDGGRSDVVLTIASGTVTFRGVTIQRGSSGIANAGTLTVENSTIVDNHGNNGGGIWNAGTLTVKNSLIASNSAGNNGGGIWNLGTVTLTGVTFQNNTPNDCTGCPGLL